MKRILSRLALTAFFALGLAAAASVASAAPASVGAAAMNTLDVVSAGNADVVEVDDRGRHRHWRKHHGRKHHRRHRHRRHHVRPRSGIYFEFGTAPSYRVRPRHVRPAPAYRLSRAHVRWCYDRYRSYRASDNTFQPYHGPRKQCVSPYMR